MPVQGGVEEGLVQLTQIFLLEEHLDLSSKWGRPPPPPHGLPGAS